MRQKGFEDTCSQLANGQEGLCYDDCMLRTSYGLMEFGEGRYVAVTEYPVYGLETKVLNLPKVEDLEGMRNQALDQRIYSCRIENWTSFAVSFTTYLSYKERETNLCVKYMTDENKKLLHDMIECIKTNLKSD